MTVRHEEIQELLGAYALDAVEPDEAVAIEDHLRDCPRCRAEVAEHRETAAFLAHAGADAPPEVWSRIASTIGDDAPAPVVPMAPRLRTGTRRSRWPVATAAVGVAAASVIGVLGLEVRDQGRRIDEMERNELAAVMAASDATTVSLTGDGGDTVPVIVRDGRAWVVASVLPELDEDRTYQLWGLAGDDLVSVAVLGRDPGVVSFDAAGYALLAITVEVAPGVIQSRNDPIVAGELA
jgi:anti-sigma factor RsiW